jgi:acyl-CoA synthetase (AMP-forming)/AMP-acid ligase II
VNYDEKPWLKAYDPAVPPELPIPGQTFTDRLEEIASEFRDKPALRFLGTTLTYDELISHADRTARALVENGCKPGDVVGINLPNIPQYLIALLGVFRAGCAASGVSPLLTAREMTHQLNDCGAKALFTADPIFENRVSGVADQLPELKFVVSTGILDFLPWIKRTLAGLLKKVPTGKIKPIAGKRVVSFMEILSKYPAESPGIRIDPDAPLLIQYTGGTTGVPKGTIITDRNMTAQLTLVTESLRMRRGREVILSGFPFFHIAGLALGMGALFQGNEQILVPDPRNTKFIVGETAKFKPTVLVNVPSLYMMLLDTPGFRELDFSGLGFCLSAASPFPAESIKALESVVGRGKVLEAYGMTEASALATCNPRGGGTKIGSVGVPLPNTSIRLVDLETGDRQVEVGEEGEIIIRGPQVMKGYLNKPEETAITLRRHDGEVWLHSGDVARMDEDGFFYIVDRTKDMLNVGGFKVFSREVEEKLYEHPAVEFCAIVGLPNPKRPGTDIVKLVVQPAQAYRDRSHDAIKEELLDFARENFAPYKVPKEIEIMEEMPLTSVGKVDKKALR